MSVWSWFTCSGNNPNGKVLQKLVTWWENKRMQVTSAPAQTQSVVLREGVAGGSGPEQRWEESMRLRCEQEGTATFMGFRLKPQRSSVLFLLNLKSVFLRILNL